jgi:hypothetical protein
MMTKQGIMMSDEEVTGNMYNMSSERGGTTREIGSSHLKDPKSQNGDNEHGGDRVRKEEGNYGYACWRGMRKSDGGKGNHGA